MTNPFRDIVLRYNPSQKGVITPTRIIRLSLRLMKLLYRLDTLYAFNHPRYEIGITEIREVLRKQGDDFTLASVLMGDLMNVGFYTAAEGVGRYVRTSKIYEEDFSE